MEQFYYQYEKNGCFMEQYVYHIGSYHYNWHKDLELMTILRGELEVCVDCLHQIIQSEHQKAIRNAELIQKIHREAEELL